MTVIRLQSGDDVEVTSDIDDVLKQLHNAEPDAFVELPSRDSAVYVRASGVIAVFRSERKGQAGFHTG